MNKIKLRILEIAEYLGIPKSRFIEDLGMNYSNFKSINLNSSINADYVANILSKYPQINPDWLLTGKGPMIRMGKSPKMVPLVDAKAIAGLKHGEMFSYPDNYEEIYIPKFKDAQCFIEISGDSMSPTYEDGDIAACIIYPHNPFMGYGNIFIINSKFGVLIKRIRKHPKKDYLLLISDNPNYDPIEMHLSDIYHLFMIIGVVRLLP